METMPNKSPIKVLVISNYKDAFNSVRPEGEIFIGLQKAGIQMTIMTQANAAYVTLFKEAGIQIIDFHPTKKISWTAIQFIRKILKEGQFDLLHLFNSKAITNGAFAAIGLPVKVLTYRGVIGGNSWWNLNSYLKHFHPSVDGITAVSKTIQIYLQGQLFWQKDRVQQYYKGQNLAWYKNVKKADLAEFDIPKNAFVVTCIANNRRSKGIRFLIKSSYFLPKKLNIHFLLIGRDMDTKAHLRLLKNSPYIDHFHLVGYRTDAINLLAASQVYIQPSEKNKEGLGKGILEAMSLGVPPIVTNSGGPKEFVTQGKSGLLVPVNNPAAIANAILQLFDNEPLRKQLGQGAIEVIRGEMSSDTSILALKKIYESFIID